MRPFVSIGLIVIVGLLAAVLTGFRTDLLFGSRGYDEEQEGLKQRIVIKFSHVVAENTPKGLAAERFAKLVREKTNGRVEVQVFPNGILYSDTTEIPALLDGEIQMIAPAFSMLSNVIPAWSVMDLPYAFRDQQDVEKAFQGEIGKKLFQTLESRNMKGLAFWRNGFKQMTSRKPIRTLDDFAGQRFRIMQSKVLETQFRTLHATPVSMPFNEVFPNLEKGLADGGENTISNIYSKRLYQVQKYMTISNHGYLGYAVIMNESFWNKLPPDIQAKIMEAMEETTAWNYQTALAMNDSQLKLLKERTDLQIHVLTPEEKAQWQQALQPVYAAHAEAIGKELMTSLEQLRKQR
ncbi:TRAP transporter substrate-binding protein [Brevibacillus sp. SYP-B805]|uniref:TRAP transporter substrate-binding protein n=1 Tax=Brevibacillus sp. SYP-B805 TaxID=1578199 RepID=UPI0013EA716D|nr:TRAP transporter substrate-binding protein [Brevibacillus sp. SYP-B805]NGQ94919.1 TRAP transporter substrate-binding protein [Brevibacillus sp. SYP-B805]